VSVRDVDVEEVLIPSTVACMLLGISRSTLYTWIQKGKIRAVKVGSQWKVPVSEVKKLKQPWAKW